MSHRIAIAWRVWLIAGILGIGGGLQAAEKVDLYFYYPGGEGTPSEAEPLMASFSKALSDLAGVQVLTTYQAERLPISELVRNPRRSLILMRLDSYLEGSKEGLALAPELMAELAHEGGSRPIYHIYGHIYGNISGGKSAAPCRKLYLGIDIRDTFVELLFGPTWKSLRLDVTRTPLDQLEEIARAGGDCILLDMRQWQALKAVPFSWKESLVLVQESAPTLPPIVFSLGQKGSAVQKVLDALSRIGTTENDRDVLSELELQRFVPLSPEERRLLEEWKGRYAP